MTLPSPTTAGPSRPATEFAEALATLRTPLDGELDVFLRARRQSIAAASPESAELVDEVARLIAGGGKRLRPALVVFAYRACGGRSEAAALRLGLATELLHTYLLIHDDIMDRSDLRRGRATTHAAFAELHRAQQGRGDAAHFGRAIAILVGDLAHTWSVELSRPHPEAEGDPVAVARAFDAMCEEVIGGQYLELLLPRRETLTAEELSRVLRLKSGRYTVERPVELGALLAGAPAPVVESLRAWGEAAGEAFQLQDDVLGTFGDAAAVGKPVASDLAEGKLTFLVHHALAGASPEDREWLRAALGRGRIEAAEIERARRVLRDSGALAAVLDMIEERLERARHALAALPLPAAALEPLAAFLDYLRERDR